MTIDLELPNGKLALYLVDERAVCEHVLDGAPAVQPTGTITLHGLKHVMSFELCSVCSAFHTLTPEQRAEDAFRSALVRIDHEDELRDE